VALLVTVGRAPSPPPRGAGRGAAGDAGVRGRRGRGEFFEDGGEGGRRGAVEGFASGAAGAGGGDFEVSAGMIMKTNNTKRTRRQARPVRGGRDRIALAGVPDFLVRRVGWERLRALPVESDTALLHRCD
jgi:hypothetical protein